MTTTEETTGRKVARWVLGRLNGAYAAGRYGPFRLVFPVEYAGLLGERYYTDGSPWNVRLMPTVVRLLNLVNVDEVVVRKGIDDQLALAGDWCLVEDVEKGDAVARPILPDIRSTTHQPPKETA